MAKSLRDIFHTEKPIIGMIHLAGDTPDEKLLRAWGEITIYNQEGLNGVIIEDYHGEITDVENLLHCLGRTPRLNLTLGINVLRDPYYGFDLAGRHNLGFVQFDSVQTPDLDLGNYNSLRKQNPNVAVLGGVQFKYTQPTGRPLEQDLAEARQRCEAIVTTGEGTGIETPIEKLQEFKKYLGDFPLIVGAGVKLDNVSKQLGVADGAIVGSYFKPKGDTREPVSRQSIREFMARVREGFGG